jgi:hypothetical protein
MPVLMAEVVKHHIPKIVEIHNYSAANSVTQKNYNWVTLNRKLNQNLSYNIFSFNYNQKRSLKSWAFNLRIVKYKKY